MEISIRQKSGGYRSDIIEAIRNLLEDRYDFHSIMKELFQNADDAKSKELHIGFVENLSGGIHPLFQTSCLIILDDGDFTIANEEAITRLGAGSKTDEKASIGRFGLGMKSIHHICEAFFYLASPNQPGAEGQFASGMVCPWLTPGIGEAKHKDWENIDQASRFLIEKIQGWAHGCNQWFALVIPLRNEAQLAGEVSLSSHDNRFPTLDDLARENSCYKLANLLPLMRNLEKVNLWNNLNSQTPSSVLEIESDAKRCSYPNIQSGQMQQLKFNINTGGSSDSFQQQVFGYEYMVDDGDMMALKKDEKWPQVFEFVNGQRQSIKIKADPHSAVTIKIAKKKSKNACLTINHAVFLPLADTLEKRSIAGEYDFQILLHGIFFLDSGRRHIYKSDEFARSIQNSWNNELLIKGVYKILLSTLKLINQENALSAEHMKILTFELANSDTLKNNIEYIGWFYKWFFCLHDSGSVGNWEMLEKDIPVYHIPMAKEDTSLPVKVFPALQAKFKTEKFTYRSYPFISAEGPKRVSSAQDLFKNLFEGLSESCFLNLSELEYLAAFFRNISDLSVESAVSIAKPIASSLSHLSTSKFKEHEKLLGDVFRCFPNEEVLLGVNDRIEWEKLKILNKFIDLDLIVLPNRIIPKTENELSIEECERIFDVLQKTKDVSSSDKSSLALAVLEKTHGESLDQIAELGEYKVFSATSFSSGKEKMFAWKELQELHLQNFLFGDKGGSKFLGLLNKAIDSSEFFKLNQDDKPFAILFDQDKVPTSDKKSCLNVLSNKPKLKGIEPRVNLFKALLGCPDNYEKDLYSKGMRYLIHANQDKFDNISDSLFLQQTVWQDDVKLDRIIKEALALLKDNWRWVPAEIANIITEENKRELTIDNINNSILGEFFQETGCSWLTDLDLTEDERVGLLKTIKQSEIWLKLPLHEDINGKYIALNEEENVFLDTKDSYARTKDLESNVVFIKFPNDSELEFKYREELDTVSPAGLLETIMKFPSPESFIDDILTSFEMLSQSTIDLNQDLMNSLKNTSWLLTPFGIKKCSDVINIPEIEHKLKSIIDDFSYPPYLCVSQIDERIREAEKAFSYIQNHLFEKDVEALEILGLLLDEKEKYNFGNFDSDKKEFENILTALQGIPEKDYPIFAIIPELYKKYGYQQLSENLFDSIQRPLSKVIVKKILLFLYKRHLELDDSAEKATIHKIFLLYLDEMVKDETFLASDLQGLYFRNKKGDWRPSEKLGFDANGVSNYSIVESSVLRSLTQNDKIDSLLYKEVSDIPVQHNADKKQLLKFFQSAATKTDKIYIGGFLALLGNNDNTILELANDLLSPRTYDSFRDELNWTNVKRHNSKNHNDSFIILDKNQNFDGNTREKSINELMDNHFFEITLTKGNKTEILNLTGELFDASMTECFESLIVGDISCEKVNVKDDWKHFYKFALRDINIEAIEKSQLDDYFKKTTLLFLKSVYNQTSSNIIDVWDDFGETEQLQIDIVQNLILRNGPFYLKQLGNLPSSKKVLNAYSAYDYKMAEQGDKVMNKQWANKELDYCINSFKDLIRNDNKFLDEALHAVKEKIKQYQYRPSSIPYEIFQNADDAYIEFETMGIEQANENFIIDIKDDILAFIHNGRPVNCYQNYSTSFFADKGKNFNFHQDLEKMLLLSFSDKGYTNDQVTGKFGLGFKSVYLLSDYPKIISSDNIAFKVTGGFYPVRLEENEKTPLTNLLGSYSASKSSTVIYLESEEDKISEAMADFLEQIPVQLIFSKRIKVFKYRGNAIEFSLEDNSEPVKDTEHIFTGKCPLSVINNEYDDFKYILLKNNLTSILLAVDPQKGFVPLPKHIYNLWVTTPLKGEGMGMGLALNGDFNLDVGRSCLAGEQNGKDHDIANELYEAFEELIKQLSGAEDFLSELGFNVSPYAIYRSLFEILTPKKDLNLRVISDVIWGENGFWSSLVREYPIVPSGLWGEYKKLIALKDIKIVLTGIMAQEENIFKKLTENSTFQQNYSPGTVMTNEFNIRQEEQKEEFSIFDLVGLILNGGDSVTPEAADQLVSVFSDNWPIFKQDNYISETCKLNKHFRKLKFKTVNGHFQLSTELVSEQDQYLYDFAPDEYRLSEEYNEEHLKFFRLCKCESEIHTKRELIISWATELNEPQSRVAFLKYLLQQRDPNLECILIEKGQNTWFPNLNYEDELLQELNDWKRFEILRINGSSFTDLFREAHKIGKVSESSFLVDNDDDEPEIVFSPQKDTVDILNEIHDWWMEEKFQQIEQYENEIYPEGKFLNLSNSLPETNEEKCEWLNFILLGTLHKIGRTHFQAHRNFVKVSNQEKWVSSLIENGSWDALSCLDGYINNSIESLRYHQWIYRIFDLRVLSFNLDETIEVMLNMGSSQFTQTTSLEDMLNTKASQYYQQGGINTYSIKPFLGIGCHFVIRELIRNNIIENQGIYQHCYLPLRRVRNLFTSLGCTFTPDTTANSKDIYNFLVKKIGDEQATFDRCFDLPFLMIADNEELQKKFGLIK